VCGDKSSIFSQIASQVAELNVADLRLPARSWKVSDRLNNDRTG
jgi:hypothetical protein